MTDRSRKTFSNAGGSCLAILLLVVVGKGTEYYNGKGGGVSFVSVKWSGDNYSTILVSFRDEKVTSKSQVGLK